MNRLEFAIDQRLKVLQRRLVVWWHSGTFANRKYEELSHHKNPKMCDPILITLLQMQPYYSQSSRENATPPSGTSPSSYKEVPTQGDMVVNFKNFSRPNKEIKYFLRTWTEFKDCPRRRKNGLKNSDRGICSAGSRPWDKGGEGKKTFFRPFGPHFGIKIRGGRALRAPPLDPPLIWTPSDRASSIADLFSKANESSAF